MPAADRHHPVVRVTRSGVLPAVAAVSLGLAWSLGPVPPAVADLDAPDCYDVDDEMESEAITGSNPVLEFLRVDRAHHVLSAVGEGVAVVLLDTGVSPDFEAADVTHVPPLGTARTPEIESPHGTVAAGIVVGPDRKDPVTRERIRIGIAPAAQLYSVPIYDVPSNTTATTSDVSEPDPAAVTAGLQWVIDNRTLPDRTVVLVPTAVGKDPALKTALDTLEEQGRLVVAPAGDRPASEEEANTALLDYVHAEGRPPGEDAAGRLWPVAGRSVLGVGVSGDVDVTEHVVLSSDVDIAAPINGAASYALNDAACEVNAYSSDLAAAVVAGVAAMVWSMHSGDTAAELRSRLLRTADGNPLTTSKVSGYGIVQPVEALERSIEPRGNGRPAAPRDHDRVGERAAPPPDREDVLADTRRNAVWWGLVGGATLVVALVLRPVLARRRAR